MCCIFKKLCRAPRHAEGYCLVCHFEHLSALKFFNGCVTMYCVSLRGNPICFESALNGCWHAFFHMLKKPNYITLYASIQGWGKVINTRGAR